MAVDYRCAACEMGYHKFFFHISDDCTYIHKIGQWPEFSHKLDDAISKNLDADHVALYRKGRRSEEHGYGIGSFAYYRRIVELVIADLLNEIQDMIPDNEQKEKYKLALEKVKDSKSAQARIEVVKELLPASLRPSNKNPLALLHDALSVGLHAESDDTCLTWAGVIREALIYLLEGVHAQKQSAKRFEKNIDEIMQKLSKVGEAKRDVQ